MVPAFWICTPADLGGGGAQRVAGGRERRVADGGPGGAGADAEMALAAGDAGELGDAGEVEDGAGELGGGGGGVEVGAAGEEGAGRAREDRQRVGQRLGAVVGHALPPGRPALAPGVHMCAN